MGLHHGQHVEMEVESTPWTKRHGTERDSDLIELMDVTVAEGTTNSGMRRSILIVLGVMVGLATRLVRALRACSTLSYAGYIAVLLC